jgi:hypothetical protein
MPAYCHFSPIPARPKCLRAACKKFWWWKKSVS